MNQLSKKKIIINLIIIVIVLIGTIYYLLKAEIITKESLSLIKPYQVLLVFSCWLFGTMLWILFDFLVHKTIDRKYKYFDSLGTVFTGFLASGVTPLKSGHFPLKAYFQNTRGIPLKTTLYGFVKCQLVAGFSSILLYLVFTLVFIFNKATIEISGSDVYLFIASLVGLGFHFLVSGAVILLSFNKKIQKWFIKFLAKLKKKFRKADLDEEEYIQYKKEQFGRYQDALKEMVRKPHMYLPSIAVYLIFSIILGSYQYFSYIVLANEAFSLSRLLYFYILNLASTYLTNIIPIPGGVGSAEYLFTVIFGLAIGKEMIGSVLVLWRISTFYLPIVLLAVAFFVYMLLYNRNIIKNGSNKANIEPVTLQK